jgi:hypothetical protein
MISSITILRLLNSKWTWFALLITIIVVLFTMYRSAMKESERLEENAEAVRMQDQRTIKAEKLKVAEMEEFYADDLQTLRDSLAVKPKQIIKYQYIKSVKNIIDTVEIHDTIVNSVPYFTASYNDKCVDASFLWLNGDSSGIFKVDVTTDMYVVDYWKRKRLWEKKWLPRWGSKEVFIDVVNNCGNDTIIENRRIEMD